VLDGLLAVGNQNLYNNLCWLPFICLLWFQSMSNFHSGCTAVFFIFSITLYIFILERSNIFFEAQTYIKDKFA
jgi:hypothetical protein